MAVVIQCDRCGETFHRKSESFNLVLKGKIQSNYEPLHFDHMVYHLCDDCMEKFDEFMMNKKKETENIYDDSGTLLGQIEVDAIDNIQPRCSGFEILYDKFMKKY